MKNIAFIIVFALSQIMMTAQVGINNTDPKATLDISAKTTPDNTDGLLIPRIDDFPTPVPGIDQDGMLVFVTGNGTPAKGFYYWDQNSTAWVLVTALGPLKIDDLIDGKSDNDGTQDGSSVFLGINAGANDNSSDNKNIGIGFEALNANANGARNTGLGYQTLKDNTLGGQNTAIGHTALANNTFGGHNTAVGNISMSATTTGDFNTATGSGSMVSNTDGNSNAAFGSYALSNNATGNDNTALGYQSLHNNTIGDFNTSAGSQSLYEKTTGDNNTVFGFRAGYNNVMGSANVFLGYRSGYNEMGSNRLYIENSNADADSALIYGEFDTNILRTNGELQIGNPTTTGYALPTTDGTAGQVLATNGTGNLSWSSASGSGATADNGLTETSGNIQLGGTITQNTTITQGSFSTTFNLDNSGSFFIQDMGLGTFTAHSNGNIGIGNTGVPNYQLDVVDNLLNGYIVNFENQNIGAFADGVAIRLAASSPGSGSDYLSFFRGYTNISGAVRGTGTGVNFLTLSDGRLKQNVTDVSQALNLLKKFRPRIYEFIATPNKKEYGFIAQELQQVFPQAVSGSPDSDVETDPMMVDYSKLTPILTAGINELYNKFEMLSEENKKLRAELAKYKSFEARISTLEHTKE